MIKRVLQGIGLSLGLLVMLVLWQWRQIRRKRQPAPLASSLIKNPDDTLSLTRAGDVLTIRWAYPSKRADIYLGDAYQALDQSRPTLSVSNQQMAMIHGINPHQRYKVMVELDDGTLTQTERVVPLPSAPNFRDIGGYSTKDGRYVRWNKVYRSSALDQLTEADQRAIHELGIRLVCDVRTQAEHESDPDHLPDDIPVVSVPPSSQDNVWVALGRLLLQEGYLEGLLDDLYQRVMVKNNPQVFREIFQYMADDSQLPMVIHCAAGKDRTGITIALLLAFLGVPDDVIIADYSLSNHHYSFFKEATRKNLAQLRIMGLTESDFDYLLIADGDVMQATLDKIREEYGSIEGYLTQYVGLSEATLAQVRQNLLV
ncbi:MAG: tyrosine-protein phosphatase [Chloroflexota bacterium]